MIKLVEENHVGTVENCNDWEKLGLISNSPQKIKQTMADWIKIDQRINSSEENIDVEEMALGKLDLA